MRRLAAALLLLLPLAVGAPRSADAKVIITPDVYTFVGVCGENDCTGTGVGKLALVNYTPGNPLSLGNVFTFDYSSNLLTFHAGPGQFVSVAGNLNDVPGENNVVFEFANISGTFNGSSFGPQSMAFFSLSAPDGRWCVGPLQTCDNFFGEDFGLSHTWAVPEPATLAVLGLGLLGLGAARRRRAA